ncbi:MAG: endonuclease/exonuclease/phosphatase family protein [Nocardioides sp.]|uniref:endonuclease/exonuclease/phosphatase family protein n=1 Tax=Nocardioides sp. TaxID=35761 RepID=UPI003D6B7601
MSAERRSTLWSRGTVCAILLLATGAAMLLHAHLPSALGIGSLVETFLPWLGAVAVLLLLVGLARRSATAVVAFIVPAAVWGWMFHTKLSDVPASPHDLVVVQHNVGDTNTDITRTTRELLAASPDIVTLDEVVPERVDDYSRALRDVLPYQETYGTVGVWSAHPLQNATPLDLRPAGVDASWRRGLRVETKPTEDGPVVAVYAVHLPSARLGVRGLDVTARNGSIDLLAEALEADDADAVIVSGDLNADAGDRALRSVTSQVTEPQDRFGFTFPAALPVVRIDHVFARGVEIVDVRPLGRTGSDHLPVVALLRWQ